MKEFLTITELIRKQILNSYNKLKQNYFNNLDEIEDDSNIDYSDDKFDDDNINELIDEEMDEEDIFEDQVFVKLLNNIKNSNYKNISFSIILHDVYECIKSKQIVGIKLYEFESALLEYIEIHELKQLIKKIETSKDFSLDLITLYVEYHLENPIENRIKNRKLIELSNNQEYLNKFKIKFYDDIQHQYVKTKF